MPFCKKNRPVFFYSHQTYCRKELSIKNHILTFGSNLTDLNIAIAMKSNNLLRVCLFVIRFKDSH